jgi:hypothetical protein
MRLRVRYPFSELAKIAASGRLGHVDGVPMDDGVEGQPEGAELFLLALPQGASDFATLPVMDTPAEFVAQLLPVELKQGSE